jgi:putative membrane protein
MMGWNSGGMGYGAWMFMGLFWLVLLGLIIWAVVRLLPDRHGTGGDGGRGVVETPEDILDKRFARGEIDLETYQAQRTALAAMRGGREGSR